MNYIEIENKIIAEDTRSAVNLYDGRGTDIRDTGAHPISGDELARIRAGVKAVA